MNQKFGILILVSVLLIVNSQLASSTEVNTTIEHILAVNDNVTHATFVVETKVNETMWKSMGFLLPKEWEAREIKAYEKEPFMLLNMTVDYSDLYVTKATVNFSDSSKSGKYKYVFEFLKSNPDEYKKSKFFGWSWGNYSQTVFLSYQIQMPGFIEITYTNSSYNYSRKFGKNSTEILFEGEANTYEYLSFWFSYTDLRPPELKLTKYLESTGVVEGEPFVITVEAVNVGSLTARNISISNDIPELFEPAKNAEPIWNANLKPGESKKWRYVLKPITKSKNELLGKAIAVYTDDSGENSYKVDSNDVNISISKAPYDYTIDVGLVKIPIKTQNPWPYIYHLLLGYFIVFLVLRTKKEDGWNRIQTFDKLIYSAVLGFINFFVTVLISIFVLSFLVLAFGLFKKSLAITDSIFYFIALSTTFLTAILISFILEKTDKAVVFANTVWHRIYDFKKYIILALLFLMLANIVVSCVRQS